MSLTKPTSRLAAIAAIVLAAVALAAVAVAASVLAPAHTASAHAALLRSNPANGEKVTRPPIRVILNFSEPIERRLTKIEVFGKDKERVDDGKVEFDDKDAMKEEDRAEREACGSGSEGGKSFVFA